MSNLWISTDEFIDVERLKSLDLSVIKGICLAHHMISSYGQSLDYNNHPDYHHLKDHIDTLPPDDPISVAYREIYDKASNKRYALALFAKLYLGSYSGGVSIHLRTYKYFSKKNFAKDSRDTQNAACFPELMDFITTLPFTEIGRVMLFVNDHYLVTPLHRDTDVGPHKNDFLWFRTNLDKKFYIFDQGKKDYVTSYSAFFNEQEMHGTDPSSKMSFAIRVDGVFTEDFRKILGIDKLNDYNDFGHEPDNQT